MKKIFSILLLSTFLLASTQTYAWRLFGSETSTVTSSDGCTVTTYEKTYFLGIRTSLEPINVEYTCTY